jgi:hypothetical protein
MATARKIAATTVAFDKGKGGGRGIRLLTEGDPGGNLTLGIRRHRIEEELRNSATASRDVRDIVDAMLARRHDTHLNHYENALDFIRLKGMGQFWSDLGYASFEDFVFALDLPTGRMLAIYEDMARTFSRETFLLVGPDLLGWMITEVLRFQVDRVKRAADYQAIFDNYCKLHSTFDQVEFRKSVAWYVNDRYVAKAPDKTKPPEREKGLSRVLVEVPQGTPAAVSSCVTQGEVSRPSAPGMSSVTPPTSTLDYRLVRKPLAAPPSEDEIALARWAIEALFHYTRRMEDLIRDNLGEQAIPDRPEEVFARLDSLGRLKRR